MNYCSLFFDTFISNDINGRSKRTDVLLLSVSTPKAKPKIGTNSTVILGTILILLINARYIVAFANTAMPIIP